VKEALLRINRKTKTVGFKVWDRKEKGIRNMPVIQLQRAIQPFDSVASVENPKDESIGPTTANERRDSKAGAHRIISR
jgi:hypothetical protein